MASINQTATLMCLSALLDQFNQRSHLTLLLNGVQGIGKSEAIYTASDKLYKNNKRYLNNCASLDGSQLFDGDLSGYPYIKSVGNRYINIENYTQECCNYIERLEAALGDKTLNPKYIEMMANALFNSALEANTEEDKELEYAKYPVIASIRKLQEYYYNKLKTEGFTLPSGLYKIDENGNEIIITETDTILIQEYDEIRHIADNYKNRFAFGDHLSPEDRIHLMLTGQVTLHFLLVDELNRPDARTMAEMMNFVLGRSIKGYNIPWWVSISGAQNPSDINSDYSTKKEDAAQLDRFCFVETYGNMDDWAIRSLNEGIPEEYVYAVINNGDKCFSPDDYIDRENPGVKPSPRSNSIVGHIIKNFNYIISLPCFSDEDRKDSNIYLNLLLNGLLGSEASNLILLAMEDKENMVTIPEILNGFSNKIDPVIKKKIMNKTIISQKMLVVSLIQWLCNNWLMVKAKKESADPVEKKEYINYYHQLAEFIGLLDPAIMNYFCDLVNTKHYDIRLADGTVKANSLLLRYIYEIVTINPEIRESYTRIKSSQID